jgi:NAD(P)-dependent dehydrogenase (short-subunit alcohol dehydrogenase family)
MQSPRPAVLITGASSGIGRATAELLASQDYRVFAGVRCQAPGGPLPEGPAGAEPVRLDVTCPDNLSAVVDQLRRECPEGLHALVNNAGVAPPAAVELADVDEVRRVLEVNVLAPLRLTQACLPLLRRARGRIVNMSSMNGKLAMPMVGAYSASKFALEALSDVLRVELRPWGVTVSLVRPGQVRTPIFAKARVALAARQREIPDELAPGYGKLYARAAHFNERGAQASTTPEAVARAIFRVLRARRPRPVYLVGGDAWGLELMHLAFPPRLMDWVLATTMGLKKPARRRHGGKNGAAAAAGGVTRAAPPIGPAAATAIPRAPDTLRSS